ncbi:unnamed protein product [Schistosoma margrebowiei]|uniref:Uncharacterized protein n=1 Tax=Schistosoma margrebowiei TaxID=48269 RepID=A0A183NA79_9TREM|nr:unnamed protein product [Schistosoma margrebowiei]
MVVGSSQQETLDPDFMLFGTRHYGVPVILRRLMLSDCEAGKLSDDIDLSVFPLKTKKGAVYDLNKPNELEN